jgi:hypothetical protein
MGEEMDRTHASVVHNAVELADSDIITLAVTNTTYNLTWNDGGIPP